MPEPDCLVVGAGPAGSAAALELARAGARVRFLARPGPRKKACGGGISPRARIFLANHFPSVDPGRALYAMEGNAPPWHRNLFEAKKPLLWLADRTRLDAAFVEEAVSAGAELVRARVSRVEWDGRRFTVRTDQGAFFAPALIGADGAAGRVRKSLGGRVRRRAVALMKTGVDTSRTADRIVFDGLPGGMGYGWVFPTSGGKGNAGVYSLVPRNSKAMFSLLCSYLSWRLGKDPKAPVTGGNIPWGGHRMPGDVPALLAGDAGGFADPLTGEGVYQALFTGRAAGRAVALAGDPCQARAIYNHRLSVFRANTALLRFLAPRAYKFPRQGGRLLSLPLVHRPVTEGLVRGLDILHTLALLPGLFIPAALDPVILGHRHGSFLDVVKRQATW